MRGAARYFGDGHVGGGALTKADARLKLVTGTVLIALVVSSGGYAFPLLVLAACICAALLLGVPSGRILLRLAEPLLIVAMLVVLKLFFTGSEEAFSIKILGIKLVGHSDGLRQGLLIAARVLGAVSVVALIGFATSFTDIIGALGRLRMPRDFVEVLMFAYRYLFMLSEEAWVIYTAQRNRLGYAGLVNALRSFGSLSGALVIRAFDHAGQTATALRQRGYEGLLPLPEGGRIRLAEVAVTALFLAAMGVLWKIL